MLAHNIGEQNEACKRIVESNFTWRSYDKDKVKIIPDDLIQTIEDFKSNLNGQTISIHGKDYATVAHRLAICKKKSW